MADVSTHQRLPLDEYEERLEKQVRNFLTIASLWLYSLRQGIGQHFRRCIATLYLWFENTRKRLEELKTKCLDVLQPWWKDKSLKMEEQQRKYVDPARPWLRDQRTKFGEKRGWVRGFVNRYKEQLFQFSIFLNVFLLLLRVTTLQMGFVAPYRTRVLQNQEDIALMRGSAALATEEVTPLNRFVELPPPLPDATRDLSSPLSNIMQEGCLAWNGPPKDAQLKAIQSGPSPTGIVVSLLLGREHLDYVCGFFPTQMEHFIVPQELDVLFVLPNDGTENRVTMQELLQCLNLSHQLPKSEKTWTNLDSSQLKTVEYSYGFMMSGSATAGIKSHRKAPSIFLAEPTIELPYYVKNDPSAFLQNDAVLNNACSATLPQVQGTRWFTDEMLHLALLKEYEYFIKLDTDVAFKKPLDFNILHDMKLRGAVFGHTAIFPKSIKMPCGEEITSGIKGFELGWQAHSGQEGPQFWKGTACSSKHPRMQANTDHYYSNFIIGRTDHFQRNEVLVLGKFLTQFPAGFFRHRWTDQIFWHFALGLFIGGPENNYEASGVVADYTEFRCAPLNNCWLSFFDQKQFPLDTDQCLNGGAFVHSRALPQHRKEWSQVELASVANAKRYSAPHQTSYQHSCPPGI